MSERFFRSNRPGYPHPVSSELENSGIRVAVGDCSVTGRRRWRPPYQTGKTVHVHPKHYKHEDGRKAPGVCGNGSVPLSHSGNVVTRIGIHRHTHTAIAAMRYLTRQFRSISVNVLPRWRPNRQNFVHVLFYSLDGGYRSHTRARIRYHSLNLRIILTLKSKILFVNESLQKHNLFGVSFLLQVCAILSRITQKL